MRTAALTALIAFTALAASCVTLTSYSGYLDDGRYDEGLVEARRQLAAEPDSAAANYWTGRFLLAKDDAAGALPRFRQATALAPDNADYQFWLGVAYWGMQDFKRERAQYLKALRLNPNHFSANLYLGHSYLDSGQRNLALAQYDKVLRDDPSEPSALYNRAAILTKDGRRDDAVRDLLRFLTYYPEGSLGLDATDRLNALGDFTYRNALLGRRNVTLRAVTFAPGGAELGFGATDSLKVVGSILTNDPKLTIHVVVYTEGDAALARARALRIRRYLHVSSPKVRDDQMPLSWFGAAETVKNSGGTFSLKESVLFITKVPATR